MGFYYDSDNQLSYRKSWLESLFGGGSSNQLAAEQFNFNKQLALRQQDLSEESYYNGVVNQANQLKSIGINPASSGQFLSGASMSGGSALGVNGSDSSAGLASAGLSSMIGLISAIAGISQRNKEIKNDKDYKDKLIRIEDEKLKNDGKRLENETNLANNQIAIGSTVIDLNHEQAEYVKAQTDSVVSQKTYQDLINDDLKLSNEQLKVFGLSRATIQSWSNISWQSAVALGIVSLVGSAGAESKFTDDENYVNSVKEAQKEVLKSANVYQDSSTKMRKVFDTFMSDYIDRIDFDNPRYSFPASNFVEWERAGKSEEEVYNLLKKHYGV